MHNVCHVLILLISFFRHCYGLKFSNDLGSLYHSCIWLLMRIWKDLFCYISRESGCQTHAATCGAGTGVFLLIRVLRSFLNLSLESLGCLVLFFFLTLWISYSPFWAIFSSSSLSFIKQLVTYLLGYFGNNELRLYSQRTTILLQRSARQAPWPSPYLDAFGEEVSFPLTTLFSLFSSIKKLIGPWNFKN